jgi:hypothetical protein
MGGSEEVGDGGGGGREREREGGVALFGGKRRRAAWNGDQCENALTGRRCSKAGKVRDFTHLQGTRSGWKCLGKSSLRRSWCRRLSTQARNSFPALLM